MLSVAFANEDGIYPELSLDSLLADTANVIVERTFTADGDTVYSFRWKAYDYGELYDNAPTLGKSVNDVTPPVPRVRITSTPVNTESYSVGEIPFSESVSPSGGMIYSVPIATAPRTKGAPSLALTYNSQSGNGVAGYGWGISGLSSISVTGKTIHFDGFTAPIDISNPASCVFALDGVRLVDYSGSLTRYHYETASGFILVEKHLAGNNVAYFTVAYPNGSTATFGFKDNVVTQLSYPITELTDAHGFKTNYYYIQSGNGYYVSRITYGGRRDIDFLAELTFDYADRSDYTGGYIAGKAVRANKLLKAIVSRTSIAGVTHELRAYRLTHSASEVNRLTQIDCSTGEDKLRPLCFEYQFYDTNMQGGLRGNIGGFISEYFSTTQENAVQFIRGKITPNEYSDGFISYVGKYKPYTVTGVKIKKNLLFNAKAYMQYGSGFPDSLDILLIPKCDYIAGVKKIKTGSGFQHIDAVDINGDGTDDVVKINFGTLSGENTNLNITKYKNIDSKFMPEQFTIPVRGVVDNAGQTYSPIKREYLYGDFRGNGKPLLLTVSLNKDFLENEVRSYLAVIDVEAKTKLSEENLFQFGVGDLKFLLPLDVDGDGKSELCFFNKTGADVYDFNGVKFIKRPTGLAIGRPQLASEYRVGDLNADGKLDFLVPPRYSYINHYESGYPVWIPRKCPKCRQSYPLQDLHSRKCKSCGVNLLEYLLQNPGVAECLLCGKHLRLIENHIPPTPVEGYYDPDTKRFSCVDHGTHIGEFFSYYVDHGNKWTAYLSTGSGFVRLEMPIVNFDAGSKLQVMDINSDGLADLLLTKGQRVSLYLNKNGLIQPAAVSVASIPKDTEILPANVCDVRNMSHFVTVDNAKVNFYTYSRLFNKEHLLTTLTDSYGNSRVNTYSDMAQEKVNKHVSNSLPYPYSYITQPLVLLTGRSLFSPSWRMERDTYYHYSGAVINRSGLGFICFEKIKTIDTVGQLTSEEFHDPLKFGVTSRVDTPVKSASYSYSVDNSPNKRHNIRLVRSTETDKLRAIVETTVYWHDSYNNVVMQRKDFGHGSKIRHITTSGFNNVVTNERYMIGLPTKRATIMQRNGNSHNEHEEITYSPALLPERRVSYVSGSKAGETRWAYDEFGNVIREEYAPYDVTAMLHKSITYDSSGRFVTTATNELGQTTEYYEYDKYGNACLVSDYKARKTRIAFDTWGRQLSTTHPDGVVEATEYAWGGKGLYTVRQDVTGKPASITHYDNMGRELRKGSVRFDGQWQYVDYAYDTRGRLEKRSLPFRGDTPKYWSAYTYDKYNRPVAFTEAQGKTTTWVYYGLNTKETKNGIATIRTLDAAGALVKTEDPGGQITYELRPDGQPESVTAPGGIVTRFGYDKYGRRTSIDDPSAGLRTYTDNYSPDGTRTQTETDAAGNTITTTSDIHGRVARVERPEFNTDYSYDPDGRLISEISTNGVRKMYSYDDFGRLHSEETSVDDLSLAKSYTYASGRLRRKDIVTYSHLFPPSMFGEEYIYQNGHLVEIRVDDCTSVWKLRKENDLGQPVEVMTGPMRRTYDYTYFGMPSRRTAGSIQDFTYNFNPHTGNLMSRTDNLRNKSESFSYDNLDRLQSINSTGISYAQNGNITQMPNGGTLSYDDEDRPYQVTSLTPIAESPLASDQTVSYTSFQRPSTIAQDGLECSLDYDAGGDRVKMSFSRTDSDRGDNSTYYLDEYEYHGSSGRRILYLGGDAYSAPAVLVRTPMSTGWSLYYICRDYLGSITHIAYSSGELKQELSYDAWGHLRNPDTHEVYAQGEEPELFLNRGYTGHEHLQQFGLINMNARLYDPVLGRFLSPDPYVQMPDFSQSFNRYSYCMNNPLKYVDKNGEFFWTIINAVKDFLRNTFIKVWTQGFNAWTNGDNWHSTKMAWKIDMGLFKGSFLQVLSRFTWELPQSILGYTASGIHNTFDGVKSVTYYDGATAVESYSENWGGFTLGSYINGHRGLQADPNNSLFQHEYGHYLQSQSSGLFYLQRYAIPSVVDAMGGSNHNFHPVEQDANIRAFKYFSKHVPNFNITDEYGNLIHTNWKPHYNPIAGYDWTKSINTPNNQSALKRGVMSLGWADFFFGPSIIIPGLFNTLQLKQ